MNDAAKFSRVDDRLNAPAVAIHTQNLHARDNQAQSLVRVYSSEVSSGPVVGAGCSRFVILLGGDSVGARAVQIDAT